MELTLKELEAVREYNLNEVTKILMASNFESAIGTKVFYKKIKEIDEKIDTIYKRGGG